MISRFSHFFTAASLIVLSGCSTSTAQEASTPQASEHKERHVIIRGGRGGHQKMMLLRSDTDGDGRVSKEEFSDKHLEKFDKMDADKDGFITEDEFSEFISKRVNRAMAGFEKATEHMDFDMGEMEEFEIEMESFGEEMAEFSYEMKEFAREASRSARRSVHRYSEYGDRSDTIVAESDEELSARFEEHKDKAMKRLDKNGDGKVSKEEYTGPDRRFLNMDKNEDGFVSRDEIKIRLHIVRELDGFPPRMEEKVFLKIDEK
jgi:Ca2+-binding EF-hand superfamily protein